MLLREGIEREFGGSMASWVFGALTWAGMEGPDNSPKLGRSCPVIDRLHDRSPACLSLDVEPAINFT